MPGLQPAEVNADYGGILASMKSSTPDCMKFKRLQRRLKTSRKETVGLLELLWNTTTKNAPQGDIGRFCNEEIAVECDWEGDHDELVAALLDCGWLDPHDECRLVVHDWADHAPNHVHSNLRRWKKDFIVPKEPPKEPPEEATNDTPHACAVTKPSQAKPSLSAAARAAVDDWSKTDWEEVARQAAKLRRACRSLPREFVWQACAVAETISPGMVADIVLKLEDGDVRKPKGYIEGALRKECEKRLGVDWEDVQSIVPPPPPVKQVEASQSAS